MRLCCLGLVFLLFGCEKAPSRRDWRPQVAVGVVDVRPLPNRNDVRKDYSDWLSNGQKGIARLYKVTINENIFTNSFALEHKRMETPLGKPLYTVASFQSRNPQYEGYMFEFEAIGKWSRETFDFSAGKEMWVRPFAMNDQTVIVRFQIVGIEGAPSLGVIAPD
jgi:hypothetical protein